MQSVIAFARLVYQARAVFAWNGAGVWLRFISQIVRDDHTPIRLNLLHHQLHIRPGTTDLAIALSCLSGELQPALQQVPPDPKLIVDAGGNIGAAAIVLAEAFPNCTIITIEPSSENFSILRLNVEGYRNVRALRAALGPEAGTSTLHSRPTGAAGFTMIENPSISTAVAVEAVEVLTIEDILRMTGCTDIALLKVDIEGAELALFQPKPEWVGKCHAIFIELHERIAAGCTRAYINATQDERTDIPTSGEKLLSVRRQPANDACENQRT